jgi:hypothetical protein
MQTIEEKFNDYYLIDLPPLPEDLSNAASATKALLPCPFCGNKNVLTGGSQNSISLIIVYRVYCTNRKCLCHIYAQGEDRQKARKEAVRRWNSRPNDEMQVTGKGAENLHT